VAVSMYWDSVAVQLVTYAVLTAPLLKIIDNRYQMIDLLRRLSKSPPKTSEKAIAPGRPE